MTIRIFCPQPNHIENETLIQSLTVLPNVVLDDSPPNRDTALIVESGRLGMINEDWPKMLPVFAEFVSGTASHRRLHGGGVGQAVSKAVGLNKRRDLRVIDGTAGLGRDAFVLATLGASVLMFERNPMVQLVLANGLSRLAKVDDMDLHAISLRLALIKGALHDHWAEAEKFNADVIYLDPMFPERAKSAKVKKDMALFHDVVGADDDADQLLDKAFDICNFRVVVKRPRHAPHLNNLKPTTELAGKTSRFDIYSKKAIR